MLLLTWKQSLWIFMFVRKISNDVGCDVVARFDEVDNDDDDDDDAALKLAIGWCGACGGGGGGVGKQHCNSTISVVTPFFMLDQRQCFISSRLLRMPAL
ncbi:unnamed protein product, partial [Ceratitis capitata]